jgi:uncharacterized protein
MANPFVHVELNTTDVDKAKEFYSKLFEWELEDKAMGPSGSYTTIKVGAGTGGGLLKNPMPGVPSFWLAYVEVDDIREGDEEGRISGREDCEELDRSSGYGLAQHHCRSDRRRLGPLANEEVTETVDSGNCLIDQQLRTNRRV